MEVSVSGFPGMIVLNSQNYSDWKIKMDWLSLLRFGNKGAGYAFGHNKPHIELFDGNFLQSNKFMITYIAKNVISTNKLTDNVYRIQFY